ncbi:hypothetical protein D9M71_666270 [compost metagenome]
MPSQIIQCNGTKQARLDFPFASTVAAGELFHDIQGNQCAIRLLPGQAYAGTRQGCQSADFMRFRSVARVAVGQRVEAGSLAFALPPVAIAKKNAYLFCQVVGQRAIETSGTQLHRHFGQISQRTGR